MSQAGPSPTRVSAPSGAAFAASGRAAGALGRLQRLLPLLLLLGLILMPSRAWADEGDGLRWTQRDQDGNRWSLRIFAQPDPAWPEGERLRFSALTPGIAVDHSRPLLIGDGAGGAWTLANRSAELVPPERSDLPEGSAQFDLDDLLPRPSDALPLALSLPLAGEDTALIVLGPEGTRALHAQALPFGSV